MFLVDSSQSSSIETRFLGNVMQVYRVAVATTACRKLLDGYNLVFHKDAWQLSPDGCDKFDTEASQGAWRNEYHSFASPVY